MEVLFIRHAKSINYENNLRQTSDSRLGVIGKKQARKTSKVLKKYIKTSDIKYDTIITSKWKRAIETAEIFSKELEIPIKSSKGIHEFISSPLIASQSLDSKIVRRFSKEVLKNSHNFDWKFNNEGESTRDVIKRAIKFKQELIKKYKNRNVIVVSHGFFITTFLVVLLLGEKYEDSLFKDISDKFKFNNCSLTKLKYDTKTNKWEINFLNDSRYINYKSL